MACVRARWGPDLDRRLFGGVGPVVFSIACDLVFAEVLDPVRLTASLEAVLESGGAPMLNPVPGASSPVVGVGAVGGGFHDAFTTWVEMDIVYNIVPFAVSVTRGFVGKGLREVTNLRPLYGDAESDFGDADESVAAVDLSLFGW